MKTLTWYKRIWCCGTDF